MRMEVGRHWWLGIIRKADRYLSVLEGSEKRRQNQS